MKFSYSLLKKILPGLSDYKDKIADELSNRAFEVESFEGDVLDIKLTANRYGDGASYYGIAKELAVIFDLPFKELETESSLQHKSKLKITIESESGCKRYIGTELLIKDKRAKTPAYIKSALEVAGIRSISCIVDILNYVMIEMGQPLHAFDASSVIGNIVVRRAKEGEKLVLIGGEEIILGGGDLVIADTRRALALAGIKGGADSEVKSNTERIILESASFESSLIYKSSRHHSLQTDASQRFGKNLSSEMAELGAKRAIDLLVQICKAEIVSVKDEYVTKRESNPIYFDIGVFKKITGLTIKEKESEKILKGLGYKKKSGGYWICPPYRTDVSITEDIVEDVLRIYGLDKIEAEAPVIKLIPLTDDPSIAIVRAIRKELVALGYSEVYNHSFSKEGNVELLNPIAEIKKYLRPGLWPGLYYSGLVNSQNHYNNVRLFEIGKTFESLNQERLKLCVLSSFGAGNYLDLAEIKGVIMNLKNKFSIEDGSIYFENKTVDHSHQMIGIYKAGEEIGWSFSMKDNALFEIDIMKAFEDKKPAVFKPLPQYPTITRDISVLINDKPAEMVERSIKELNLKYLESMELLDIYEKNVSNPELRTRTITFRLTFRSPNETLREEMVNEWMKSIEEKVKRLEA